MNQTIDVLLKLMKSTEGWEFSRSVVSGFYLSYGTTVVHVSGSVLMGVSVDGIDVPFLKSFKLRKAAFNLVDAIFAKTLLGGV